MFKYTEKCMFYISNKEFHVYLYDITCQFRRVAMLTPELLIFTFRITPAVSTYILNELLRSSDPNIRRVAERYDWYFFPVFNPDGYEYTHTTVRFSNLILVYLQ